MRSMACVLRQAGQEAYRKNSSQGIRGHAGMYHCHLHFCFIGSPSRAFEVIREMPPLERFTHTFSQESMPGGANVAGADVVFANLQGADEKKMLGELLSGEQGKRRTILLMEKGQFAFLADGLAKVEDIWMLPMTDGEIRFRFLKWQQNCKMRADFWLTDQYFETMINSIPNLVWYKDKEGLHQKVNDSFCRTVNKTKKQVEGRDHFYIWDVDPCEVPDEENDCMESDLEVMRKKKTCVSDEVVKTGSGMRQMTTYKSPLYDLDGTIMGTVGVGIDVTQERRYEQEITRKSRTLETIFTTLDCGVLCHTVDGSRILSVNQAALNILGYQSKEEMMAMGFNMVAPSVMDEDKPKLRRCIRMLKNVGDSVNAEYRVQHDNGEILHVMGNIKLLEENGELFYQRFLLDCTAQKIKEKENERHQMELVQALGIDYSLVCFFNLDTGKGIPLRIGEDGYSALDTHLEKEISLEESMGHYISKLVYEEDREMLRQASSVDKIRRELEEKKQYYVNYRIFRDGKMEYYVMKIVRAGDWGQSHGIVLGFRSVDEETRNEMEKKQLLENALMQANEANRAKSVFLSNMSHDIRTPMNAIVGFTDLSLTHIDEKEQVRGYLQKIKMSGNHLLNLINDVLDMSRIESGKMQLEEKPCSLPCILQDIMGIVHTALQEKGLELRLDAAGVRDKDIYCDKLRLNQVLLNVLGNSIKYTDEGGLIKVKITEKAGVSMDCANYEFRIRDTGVGMSREFLTSIFEPFEREKNTTNSGIQGTGLGMAITKNLVDMMNGTIEVESQRGVGTEVTLSFPFRLNFEKLPSAGREEWEDSGLADREGKNAKLSQGRILLVEDNELNQEIAVAILEDAGFDMETAKNGQAAVDMIKNSSPGYYSLVLMDIQMPVMDGYEATRQIRRMTDRGLASIPILAMTANAFEEDKREALKCGMNGHIAKPIQVEELFHTLNEVLG